MKYHFVCTIIFFLILLHSIYMLDTTIAPVIDNAPIKLSTTDIDLKIRESKERILEGKLDKSIEGLMQVVESDVENFEGNRLLGAVLLSLNRSQLAENFLYNAVRVSNWKDLHSVANLAECLRVNGDPDLGEKTVMRGLNVSTEVDDGTLAFTLGAIYSDKRKYTLSSEWYLVSALKQVNNIEAWLRASTMKFSIEFQNVSTAEYVLMQAIQRNANNAELIYNLALALHIDNRPNEAIALYNVVRELDPKEQVADVKGALATALHATGRSNEAFQWYQLALKSEPNSDVLLSNFAILLCSNDRRSDGIEVIRRAYTLAPNSEDTKKAMAVCDVRVQI